MRLPAARGLTKGSFYFCIGWQSNTLYPMLQLWAKYWEGLRIVCRLACLAAILFVFCCLQLSAPMLFLCHLFRALGLAISVGSIVGENCDAIWMVLYHSSNCSSFGLQAGNVALDDATERYCRLALKTAVLRAEPRGPQDPPLRRRRSSFFRFRVPTSTRQ